MRLLYKTPKHSNCIPKRPLLPIWGASFYVTLDGGFIIISLVDRNHYWTVASASSVAVTTHREEQQRMGLFWLKMGKEYRFVILWLSFNLSLSTDSADWEKRHVEWMNDGRRECPELYFNPSLKHSSASAATRIVSGNWISRRSLSLSVSLSLINNKYVIAEW